MRHVVIYEPDPSGHRMVFVRYIAEAMARHGGVRATLITSPRAMSTPWVGAIRDTLHARLSFCLIDEPVIETGLLRLPAKLTRQFAHSRLLRSAVGRLQEQEPVDYVFVPFADDYCLFPFAVRKRPFGASPWGGIVIRPRFHLNRIGAVVPRRRADWIEGWAYRGLLRNRTLDILFSIDPFLSPYFDDPRVATVCDPADITVDAPDDSWLTVSENAVVLLVYGYIDGRKAIDRLLKVVADPRVPTSLTITIVGTQDPEIKAVLTGPSAVKLRESGRLVELARRASDAEEAAAFMRADIVWGYYPGNYCSSGAMVRAGRMGRPLIATDEGLIGHLTRQYQSGLTAPESDDEVLLQQLVRLSKDAALRGALGEAGRHLFKGATGTAFGDRIVNRLANTLNAPANAGA